MNTSFYVINKLGAVDGIYKVTVAVGGGLLRRVLEDPANTPGGATPLPAGFQVHEHTHSVGTSLVRPGVASGTTETWSVTEGDTLTVSVAGAAAGTATIGEGDVATLSAATAEELAAVITRDIAGATGIARSDGRLVIVADDDSDSIQVTGGTLNTPLQFATTAQTGDLNGGNQPYYHSVEADDVVYQVDIVDPNQDHTDLAPTLRSWSENM